MDKRYDVIIVGTGAAGLYAVVKEGIGDRVYFREFSDPRKEAADLDLRIIGRVCEIRRKMT